MKFDLLNDQGQALAAGELDIGMNHLYSVLLDLDGGKPLVVFSGIHGGCYELFGTGAVRAIRDLKGKTVATPVGASGRQYDSADSPRFYALRLHEAGVIKSSPQKVLAQGTDWRFVDQLRKELKT